MDLSVASSATASTVLNVRTLQGSVSVFLAGQDPIAMNRVRTTTTAAIVLSSASAAINPSVARMMALASVILDLWEPDARISVQKDSMGHTAWSSATASLINSSVMLHTDVSAGLISKEPTAIFPSLLDRKP